MEALIGILIAIGALVVIILPLKIAAAALGAKRTGFFWCLLALIGASILHGLGMLVPVIGTLVAFLLSAMAFAGILGTGSLRGVGIALLYIMFLIALVFLLSALGIGTFGVMQYIPFC